MVLDLPLNGEFTEFPISATGVKYTHSPTDYKRLYKEEMKPPRDGRDVPHPPFLNNNEGSAPPFFKFREVLDIATHVASANRSNFDIGVYEAAFNAGPAESLVNLGLFDGLNAESLPSFHRYMSRGNEFYADKTFMLTPVRLLALDHPSLPLSPQGQQDLHAAASRWHPPLVIHPSKPCLSGVRCSSVILITRASSRWSRKASSRRTVSRRTSPSMGPTPTTTVTVRTRLTSMPCTVSWATRTSTTRFQAPI